MMQNATSIERLPDACGKANLSPLIHEPAEVYHARSGEYLSSHLLADFRKCPQLFHQRQLGIVEDADRPEVVAYVSQV